MNCKPYEPYEPGTRLLVGVGGTATEVYLIEDLGKAGAGGAHLLRVARPGEEAFDIRADAVLRTIYDEPVKPRSAPPNPLLSVAGLFTALGVDLSGFGHEDEPARGSFEVEEFEDIKTAVAAFETALAKAQHVDHASTLLAAFVNSPLPLDTVSNHEVSLVVHPQVPSELLFKLAAHLICAAEEHERREALHDEKPGDQGNPPSPSGLPRS